MNDVLSIVDQLANTASFNPKKSNLLNCIPSELQQAYISGNFFSIRQILSNCQFFPDARTVAN